MKETQAYISAQQDRFLTELLEWLRIPSISADPAYAGSVRQAAEWMADNLKKAGLDQVRLFEAAFWTVFYIGAAIAFGYLLPGWSDAQSQKEFFAGWLTEYALSVDNIFVFIIILGHLHVKKEERKLAED